MACQHVCPKAADSGKYEWRWHDTNLNQMAVFQCLNDATRQKRDECNQWRHQHQWPQARTASQLNHCNLMPLVTGIAPIKFLVKRRTGISTPTESSKLPRANMILVSSHFADTIRP